MLSLTFMFNLSADHKDATINALKCSSIKTDTQGEDTNTVGTSLKQFLNYLKQHHE